MRQNNYSGALQQRDLYTPQMIVNGETEFTGSDKDKAGAAIGKALKAPPVIKLSVQVDSVKNDTLYVNYSSSKADKNFSFHVAIVEDHLESKVSKGENSGKALTHNHVVRIFYSHGLGSMSGSVAIPLKGFRFNANCTMISFAQHKQSMKILGATETPLKAF